MDCPQQEKRSKRESESEIRENRYISPWSIMLRLLFALGPSAALHSTYTSLLISQTPAVCQLILTFSKSITPLSKVSVPANLYCAQTHTHTHTHTQYYILTHQKKVNERESVICVSGLLSATDDGIQVSSATLRCPVSLCPVYLLSHISSCPLWTCLVIIQG